MLFTCYKIVFFWSFFQPFKNVKIILSSSVLQNLVRAGSRRARVGRPPLQTSLSSCSSGLPCLASELRLLSDSGPANCGLTVYVSKMDRAPRALDFLVC